MLVSRKVPWGRTTQARSIDQYYIYSALKQYLTNKTCLVRKLHIARKYMFNLLYNPESMDYCLITSTNCFINQQMLNIKGLK